MTPTPCSTPIFNFSAGPAMLPGPVIRQIQAELADRESTGVSVMERSHRSQEFVGIAEAAEQDLRELLDIPRDYHVLFLPGGARGQFAAVPLNILGHYTRAAYVETGIWSRIAIEEASRLCTVQVVASAQDRHYTDLPEPSSWQHGEDVAYLHYVCNETVNGVEFPAPPSIPITGELPLVADMSSNLLTRPIPVERYRVIYACAQKNLGIAGITVVIVKDDMLSRSPMRATPRILNYRHQAEAKSMLNTPPTFPWYVLGLMTQWVKAEGGVAVMGQRAQQRSQHLYDYIDHSGLYRNPVDKAARSRINVIFFLQDERLNERFIAEATQAGLVGLRGHRAIGGMRASLYNAMPQAGVERLVTFMKDFEQRQ